MKATVIGANGYLGRHLAYFLLGKGWQVYGYGNGEQRLPGLTSYTKLNVADKEEFAKLNTDVDFIFYFSGYTGTYKAFNEYEHYIDVNEKGLLHLLDKLRFAHTKPRVVFPSTRLVYKGREAALLTEDSEKEFKTIYALTKWFGEQVLQQYAIFFDIPFSIFRICVPYGNLFDGEYSYGTIGFFLNRAFAGQDITLFGDGSLKRTFTHVEDICRQIFYAIIKETTVNSIYNVDGEAYSLKEVADQIAAFFKVGVTFSDWPLADAKLESGDTVFDSSKLRQLIDKPLKNNFKDWLKTIK